MGGVGSFWSLMHSILLVYYLSKFIHVFLLFLPCRAKHFFGNGNEVCQCGILISLFIIFSFFDFCVLPMQRFYDVVSCDHLENIIIVLRKSVDYFIQKNLYPKFV